MKKITLFILLIPFFLPAQTLTRTVISSGGESSNPQLRWTLGEVATTNSTAGGFTLSQGFQQPKSIAAQITSQIISLAQGWNLISSFIQPANANLSAVFSPIAGQIILVKDADGKIFIPGSVNTIVNWETGKGYQVKTASATNLTISGTQIVPQNTAVPVKPGWQIIPYLRISASNAATVLNSINGNIVIVKNNAGQIYTVSPLQINTIGNLTPGQGFWLKSTGNGTLIYPSN